MIWNTNVSSVLLATLLCAATVSTAQTPPVRTLSEQEMIDIMVGSSIQATRSSNSARMIDRVKEAFAQGKTFTMISTEDLPDDWTIAIPGAVGGGGAWEHVLEDVRREKLSTVEDPSLMAMRALAEYSGKKIDAVARVEAAGATLQAFSVAASLGVPVVDSCFSGRARPEVAQSLPTIYGVQRSGPSVTVSRWGDTVILTENIARFRRAHILRGLAVSSGGVVWSSGVLMSGADIKQGTIPGAVSQAMLFGRTVREAVEQGTDPIGALVDISDGYTLFEGTVAKTEVKGERGFTYRDVELKGINEYEGHTYKIYVKNENIVTWLDGEPDAMSPDFISNLNPKTGDAITGGEGLGAYPMGMEVTMVGIPAHPMWRDPRGIEVFGPRHFGFDFDYVPIEEQMKRRPQFEAR